MKIRFYNNWTLDSVYIEFLTIDISPEQTTIVVLNFEVRISLGN
jgi:hypothetical protein